MIALSPQLSMLLPDGNGAWTVEVTSTGGILGTQNRASLSSEGKTSCDVELQCPKNFRTSDFQPLIEVIHSRLPVPPVQVVSFCSDCIKRTITIRRRDAMGVVDTYSASWDETSKSQLPLEVIRIYDAVTALMK